MSTSEKEDESSGRVGCGIRLRYVSEIMRKIKLLKEARKPIYNFCLLSLEFIYPQIKIFQYI